MKARARGLIAMLGACALWLILESAGPAIAQRGSALDRPAPEFPSSDPGDWINSAPLRMASLKGKVVLLDIWTYG